MAKTAIAAPPINDFENWITALTRPTALTELAVMAVCVGLGWCLVWLVRKAAGTPDEKSILFGQRLVDGVLFPVAALERTLPFPASLTEKVTEQEFLHHIAHVSSCRAPLYRANVFKHRVRFTLEDCPVEIDRILVNGAAIESIAIESQCAAQVLSVRSALGLEQFENISYPLAISRILGIRPLPDAEGYE